MGRKSWEEGIHSAVQEKLTQQYKATMSLCSVAQSCLTLCDPVDCSSPGSSAHGIYQARILEWGAISHSRGSSQTRDQTHVSHLLHLTSCRQVFFFTTEPPGKTQSNKTLAHHFLSLVISLFTLLSRKNTGFIE